MLPTPSTSHVNTDRIYDPAEDSFLLLDTFSSESEVEFLQSRFMRRIESANELKSFPAPLVLEVGTGSGVILAFVTAHAKEIFGRADILSLGTDINRYACQATEQTVRQTCHDRATNNTFGKAKAISLMAIINADLTAPIRTGMIDLLIFNPPYVPTSELPKTVATNAEATTSFGNSKCEDDSDILALSYAGGVDGMEVTSRLLDQIPFVLSKPRGVAYILLCRQNKPEKVIQQIQQWGSDWTVSVVGHSGKTGGWEKLQVIRICRVMPFEVGNLSLPETILR
ncbi:S-adenosylmethionine-dependent methyltransferase [Pseudocyphellaria aurata]|nr:S-adenosylmethionine-dependent methyltransferase [Pseudocyphellaria aurata]